MADNNIDWIIHYVQEHDCDCCGKHNEKSFGLTGFANIHTHGLDKYGHKELCIPLDIGKVAGSIINDCGLKIAAGEKFEPGIKFQVIQNYPVFFYEFDKNSDTLYMIMPDKYGRFPVDEDCEFPFNQQMFFAAIIEEENKEIKKEIARRKNYEQ